ncbi:regulatory protein RecX [Foetidibacter luteolus]|uniref:regulatory protein RecX n=1 Tax=Foetidibacter luteolus TaxID=2608880 RepID=UPI001F1B8633|nr:regulatory protein RecX [Foetidibacter luteolus]
MPEQRYISKDKALQKIKHFCAWQERSHKEVKEKLYSFGLRKTETEDLLALLIEENYLNEERFAREFAGGKFRLKHWGRIKIQYELKQKQVSNYNINNALKTIDETDYTATLKKLAAVKYASLQGENHFMRRSKTAAYLQQKGFEKNLVDEVLKDISTGG